MIPIQDLLHRIRWDAAFAAARFEIGYYDRVERRVVLVPFSGIHFDPSYPLFFQIVNAEGGIHSIPLHRIRDVYRDGQLIWHRGR
jgi:uncharacterized protein (UPF0248 family)